MELFQKVKNLMADFYLSWVKGWPERNCGPVELARSLTANTNDEH